MPYKWTCPFCKQPTTITDNDEVCSDQYCFLDSAMGKVCLQVQFIACPNTECQQLSLTTTLFNTDTRGYSPRPGSQIMRWNLIPRSSAKVYSPEVVPQVIIEDYQEACSIRELSPKSSATLARRALQGMIRDFWEVKKPKEHKGSWNLFQEIQAIKDKVEPEVWLAIDSVRDVGNIGAHMEQDVNVIIDVDTSEAQKLIELIEMLIEEWYVARHVRKLRLEAVIQVGAEKKVKKQEAKTATS